MKTKEMIKGPMRLRKEEGLQIAVREGEQTTETRKNEKKPKLSWPTVENYESHIEVATCHDWGRQWRCSTIRGSIIADEGVKVPREVANQSAKAFEWEWSEWEWKWWEWEVSKLVNFKVFGAKQWLKDFTTSVLFFKKTDVNEVTSTSVFQKTNVEFSLCS